MTPTEFAECQLPTAPIVLGVQLLPFMLGHAIALDRVDSAFRLGSGREPGLGDVLVAVLVCSHPPCHIPTAAQVERFGRRQRKLSAAALRRECNAMAVHVLGGYAKPQMWEKDEPPKDNGVPLLLSVKVGLMSRLHLSEQQALETPLRLAIWQLIALNAVAGAIDLFTESDQQRVELAKQPKPSREVLPMKGRA